MPPNRNHYTRIREKRTIQQKQKQVKMTMDKKSENWNGEMKKEERRCCAELWRPYR